MSEAVPAWRRLHPATLVSRWLRQVPQMAGGGAAMAATIGGWGRLLLFGAVAGAIGLAATFVWWWRFRYRIGENEIVIESGIFQRQRRAIPFARVQDIAIERRMLARLFGTARVKIETGGSSSDEGMLDMIALADAQALRDWIRSGRGQAPAAVEGEPVLFAMALPRLLLSGLFNFSLLFLAVIFAVLQNLDQFGFVRVEDWYDPARASAAADALTLQSTLGLIALLLLLGLVYGVVRTVARDFGFRLTRTGGEDGAPASPGRGGLRRRRGLFTLSEVVIPIRRAQVAVIETGPIARSLGWCALSFQTLGAERKEGGVQTAAPFARMEEVLPILAEAGFPAPPPRADFVRIPSRALWRRAAPFAAGGVIATAVAFLLLPPAGLAAAILLLVALYAALRWRKHAYAIDERALFVTHGLLKRRLWIVPFERAQTISVARGPLQRPLRLASLLVDTAGASALNAPEIVDLDSGDADALADRLLALFYEARGPAPGSMRLSQ